MDFCPDSCRMMKHIPTVSFDFDCVGQTCVPSITIPHFAQPRGAPLGVVVEKSFVRHKPWPEPLRRQAPPPSAHRSPLRVRSTPSLQPRTPRLGRELYSIRHVSDCHIAFSPLPQQGCTLLQRVIHGRLVVNAMSKAVGTHDCKNCTFCISSPPLAPPSQHCRLSNPRSRSPCIINSR
jgi:hypothetical protein